MNLDSRICDFFGTNREVVHASAPGRLDVMGGIADYSGSFVLQMPIAGRTNVYASLRRDGILRVYSHEAERAGLESEAQYRLDQLIPSEKTGDYRFSQKILSEDKKRSWAAYVLGCVLGLIQEKGVEFNGADFWVDSDVPIGKGVSSSAALEIATLAALSHALQVELSGNELPALGQKVENYIVGAPCGLMDQLAAYFGRKDQLLPILCRPDILSPPVGIPKEMHFVGVDSGERHSVGGASYGDVRTAAFMGYSIIADNCGVDPQVILEAKRTCRRDGLPLEGYLSKLTPSQYESRYESILPGVMSGEEFISRFGDTIDPITSPQPDRRYAVKACTAHPIYENHRVIEFALLLQLANSPHAAQSNREDAYFQLGELMYQSHWSYSRCGLGSEATDALVKRAYEAGSSHGVYGAKITGGGSGGTVCFLCIGEKGLQSVQNIAQEHAAGAGCELTIFHGSSDGACWTKTQSVLT
ncbi:MAG: GHMP kinase [Candidatus Omnitrophica bacterium]|nr:GHMP kinase [Candidatus Omnitrophota bacterium]